MKLWRIAAVFAGLAAAGALVGAVTGMSVAAILLSVMEGPRAIFSEGGVYSFAASVGAVCGTVLVPVASLAFMRHVPLWRLFTETAVGTLIGGVIGLRVATSFHASVGIAAIGFLAAGSRLALVYRKPSAKSALNARLPGEES